MRPTYTFILILGFLTACVNDQQSDSVGWPVNFEELIHLQCRAIELRETRFAIADSLRFMNDSLSINSDSLYNFQVNEHLKKLYRRQEVVSQEGYALADTIRNRMELVMKELDPIQKRLFNDSVNSSLSLRGCN